jgi:IS1 family transposase
VPVGTTVSETANDDPECLTPAAGRPAPDLTPPDRRAESRRPTERVTAYATERVHGRGGVPAVPHDPRASVWVGPITRLGAADGRNVTKLLIDAGSACAECQHNVMRNLSCRRLQLDEIWGFVYAKGKNVPDAMKDDPGVGSIWTWVVIDAETKLIPSWLVGLRDLGHAAMFVCDLAERLSGRVQVTTDGLCAYVEAMEQEFGGQVDHAVLVKVYGKSADTPETRYSPPECVGCQKVTASSHSDPAHVSTSYVERQNLNMRMRMRRLTRLTNAFSKKLENLEHAVALHFFAYNFITRHGTLRMPLAL